MIERLRILLTGRVVWEDADTGDLDVEVLDWKSRWQIFGIHSYDWRWVSRYGTMPCGCVRNPLTRTVVLYDGGCPYHTAVRCACGMADNPHAVHHTDEPCRYEDGPPDIGFPDSTDPDQWGEER